MCGSDIFLGLIAIIFPPLPVWVKRGICSADSLINIALCCLAYLPGLLHAWYIIGKSPDPTYQHVEDAEQGRVTYYYVQSQPARRGASKQPSGSQPQQRGYGTVSNAPDAQFPSPQPQPQPEAVQQPAQTQAGPSGEVPPPSYQQATGDNKIQGP